MNKAMWEEIANNKTIAAIHCPTQELADEVEAVVKGITGRGFNVNHHDYWKSYRKDTCYYPNVDAPGGRSMQFSDINWARNNDMIIYEAIDLLTDVDELPISLS